MNSSETIVLRKIVRELESGGRPKGGIVDGQGGAFSLGGEHLDSHGDFDLTNERRISLEFFNEMKRGKVKPYDILIVKDGATTGKASFVPADFAELPCAINEHVFRLSVKPDLAFPKYVFYYLYGAKGNKEIMMDFRGATIGGISQEFVQYVHIPLPPLPEQERIAAILDKADRLRRLRSYAIELGDSYLQSVFLEMFGDPVANPMGWEMRKLGKHIKFITSGSRGWAQYYSPSGARFIRSLDVRMNYIANSDAVFVIPPKSPETERTRVQANDVLLTITGSRIGRVAPVPKNIGEAYISQHVSLLRLDDELSPEYISRFLSLPRGGQYQIAKSQYGQTKPGLNLTQIKDFRILFPPKPMREKYLEIVQRYERLRSQQRESLRQAEHFFESLLSQAFEKGV